MENGKKNVKKFAQRSEQREEIKWWKIKYWKIIMESYIFTHPRSIINWLMIPGKQVAI